MVCVFVAVLSETAVAQAKRKTNRKYSIPVRRELITSTPEPPGKIGQVVVSFHGHSNRTQVGVSLMLLSKPKMELAEFFVAYLLKGKELIRPGVVEFRLKIYGAKTGIFQGRAAFELNGDGRLLKFDNVKRKRDSITGMPEQLMSGNTSFAQFEQIAGSNEIELRAGSLRFVLRDIDREGMRDLLRAAAGTSVDK